MGLSAHASPAQVAFTERLLLDCPTTVKAAFGPALSSFDLAHALRFLTVPTTVMVGCHDRLTPPSAARRLSDALPSAQLVELPGAGHMAPLEAHAVVSATIRGCAERLLRPEPGSMTGGEKAGRG
jgi:pimeloyl-ACP methyl ester carboxylesterase